MNLFRSEEHLARWLGTREPGATIPVAKLAGLAFAWWDDRISPEWTPHTRTSKASRSSNASGLVGEFWELIT